jgi:hypothetical protein
MKMNERIKELILQSVTFRLDPDSECYEAQVCPEDLESLAELIVQECLEIAIEEERHAPFEGPVETKIRQHFGVEE